MRVRIVLVGFVCLLFAFGFWFGSGRGARRTGSGGLEATVEEKTSGADSTQVESARRDAAVSSPNGATFTGSSGREVDAGRLPQNETIAPRNPSAPPMLPGSLPVVSPRSTVERGRTEISPEEVALDVDKITLSLRDYRTVMHQNPVGTNAEITHALNGGNPRQARLLPEAQPINGNGEMIDRWGTPYFFHQLSKDHMEVRSAGPDKTMWTPDDTMSN